MAFNPLEHINAHSSQVDCEVAIPEWEMLVRLKPQTGRERAKLDDYTRKFGDAAGRLSPVALRSVVLSLVISGAKADADEGPFTDWVLSVEEATDLVSDKSAVPIERLFNVGLKMLGLTTEEKENLEKK